MTSIKLLTTKDVSNMLGISVKTIYAYLSYKQLPQYVYRRIGTKVLFIESELEKWIIDGCKLERRCKYDS